MICKWCGAAVNSADNKCRRCGKELAPLSQCGGFYDLMPMARPAAAPAPEAPSGKKSSPVTGLLAVLCVILVAALVFTLVSMNGLRAENEKLERKLEKLEESGVPEESGIDSALPWPGGADSDSAQDDLTGMEELPDQDAETETFAPEPEDFEEPSEL